MTLKMPLTRELYLIRWNFFYGGNNDNFVRAIGFLSPRTKKREFITFFWSNLGQNVMINKQTCLSIHLDSGDIFYQNYNTGENFYKLLLAQQDDQKAFVSKKFSYRDSFEKYIDSFLPSFLICTLIKILSIYFIDLMTT